MCNSTCWHLKDQKTVTNTVSKNIGVPVFERRERNTCHNCENRDTSLHPPLPVSGGRPRCRRTFSNIMTMGGWARYTRQNSHWTCYTVITASAQRMVAAAVVVQAASSSACQGMQPRQPAALEQVVRIPSL